MIMPPIMNELEIPMTMARLRAKLSISTTYFSAMKSAMGIKRARMGTLGQFAKFIATNPTFKCRDVYHRPGCGCANCLARRTKKALL